MEVQCLLAASKPSHHHHPADSLSPVALTITGSAIRRSALLLAMPVSWQPPPTLKHWYACGTAPLQDTTSTRRHSLSLTKTLHQPGNPQQHAQRTVSWYASVVRARCLRDRPVSPRHTQTSHGLGPRQNTAAGFNHRSDQLLSSPTVVYGIDGITFPTRCAARRLAAANTNATIQRCPPTA